MAELSKSPNLLLLFFHLLAIISKTVPLANSLSFNYPNFADTSNITLVRAFAENQEITLAERGFVSGRATYFEPVKLWDNATGQLTDFATRFTFVIDSDNRTKYGDGMAFFLAREGSKLNSTALTSGGSLGINEKNSFVAVEFDIFSNDYDPVGAHVGIDINSMRSVANVTWLCNVREGKKNEAFVVYNSTTQELSVNFTGFRGDVVVWQFLSHKFDLKSLFPEEVTLGFSASTGGLTATHRVCSWDFRSTLEESDQPSSVPPSVSLAPKPDGPKKRNLGLPLGLGLGGFVVLVCGFCIVLYFDLWKKIFKRDKDEIRMRDKKLDDEFQKGTGPKKFSYEELSRATSNFKDQLGQGGFGGVYKGFLSDLKAHVAIKRVSKGSSQGMKEYATEVKIISKLRHRNLVQLIGWCHEKGDLLLVYDYMPNGSLDSHLFKENYDLLSWEKRYKIAQGLATGLLYLHEEWEQCVLHRDIKSSNVMLDSNFNAKLGDFGLATLMDHSKGSQTITNVAGTPGYMAPEFFMTYKASKETDVYRFGIVCLELACGRKPIDLKKPKEKIDMVKWVWELYGEGKILEAADQKLDDEDFDVQQMICLMIVGLWCAHPDFSLRPSISEALQVIGFKNKLPSLPPKMPVHTYILPDTPQTSISCDTSNYSRGH